jgi:hypothetical protein
MSDFLLKSTVMMYVNKLNSDVRIHVNKLMLPDVLHEIIAQYTDFIIDDYVGITSMQENWYDIGWVDGSGLSRWSHIILRCSQIMTRGVVTITHSQHQMSIIKLEKLSVDINFEVICKAISTHDYRAIENMIFPDNNVLNSSELSSARIRSCTMLGLKRLIVKYRI